MASLFNTKNPPFIQLPSPSGFSRFEQWLQSGYHGEMEYLNARREAYSSPSHVMEGARSIVMLALSYQTAEPNPVRPGTGSAPSSCT